jgi:hypothetical protein
MKFRIPRKVKKKIKNLWKKENKNVSVVGWFHDSPFYEKFIIKFKHEEKQLLEKQNKK